MKLSEFLYILGVDLIPFIGYIGYATKPRRGFYYLCLLIIFSLTLPTILSNGFFINLELFNYFLLSINASIFTLMLIGHWFLVDPTISRVGMKNVAKFGIFSSGVAMFTELNNIYQNNYLDSSVLDYVVAGLFFATCILVLASNLALNEKGYSGVMAATGLSYLSFLTSIGAVGTLLLVS